jgi:RNA polymerase sigma-70 factor (ECF subfamily)
MKQPERVAPFSPAHRARDAALVTRFRSGDQSAFCEIYERYYDRVYAFTMRRVEHPAEAEDLTQETFVRLLQCLSDFEGRSSLLTWILGIAHNVCAGFFRSRSRWMTGSTRGAREFVECPTPVRTEHQVDAARLLDRCNAALEADRRAPHRRIFHLRYAESQSIKAIAVKVGRSNEAVKISLRRSRALLSSRFPEASSLLAGHA